ncbi:sugar transferase [Christiangramia sp.]|uniref:sugar transferase n=1 Tax=Christiangramia sp. TaxID=1931228 RepID=UPI00262DBE33|nr:sugar transferase [Christiangramia sp.]
MYIKLIKPFLDFIVSLLGLILISPLLIVITILLAMANKGKPFFFQKRPGKFGKNFRIVKFKTMTDAKDENGELLPDAERLTTIGKFVRKTSIDEIPQLFNVLAGDMSIVGPRPLLPEYLNLYSKRQSKRHRVRPGITGWAQVNGRNTISWTQKFEFDVWYVENVSFVLDLKIIFRTIKKVLISEGINTQNMATTEPFNGKN